MEDDELFGQSDEETEEKEGNEEFGGDVSTEDRRKESDLSNEEYDDYEGSKRRDKTKKKEKSLSEQTNGLQSKKEERRLKERRRIFGKEKKKKDNIFDEEEAKDVDEYGGGGGEEMYGDEQDALGEEDRQNAAEDTKVTKRTLRVPFSVNLFQKENENGEKKDGMWELFKKLNSAESKKKYLFARNEEIREKEMEDLQRIEYERNVSKGGRQEEDTYTLNEKKILYGDKRNSYNANALERLRQKHRKAKSVDIIKDLNMLLGSFSDWSHDVYPYNESLYTFCQRMKKISLNSSMWIDYRHDLLLKYKKNYANKKKTATNYAEDENNEDNGGWEGIFSSNDDLMQGEYDNECSVYRNSYKNNHDDCNNDEEFMDVSREFEEEKTKENKKNKQNSTESKKKNKEMNFDELVEDFYDDVDIYEDEGGWEFEGNTQNFAEDEEDVYDGENKHYSHPSDDSNGHKNNNCYEETRKKQDENGKYQEEKEDSRTQKRVEDVVLQSPPKFSDNPQLLDEIEEKRRIAKMKKEMKKKQKEQNSVINNSDYNNNGDNSTVNRDSENVNTSNKSSAQLNNEENKFNDEEKIEKPPENLSDKQLREIQRRREAALQKKRLNKAKAKEIL